MNFETLNKQRKFILIAAAVGVISMFLPWIKMSFFGMSQSVNGMHDKGILVFLCFVVAGVLSYLGDQTKNLDKTFWFITLAAGALSILLILWFYLEASDSFMGASFIGFGVYLSTIAAIGILASAYLFRAPGDDIKSGFDSLKGKIEQKTKNEDQGNT